MIPKVIGHVKFRQIPPLFFVPIPDVAKQKEKVDTLRRAVEKEQAEIATLRHGIRCKTARTKTWAIDTILISVGGILTYRRGIKTGTQKYRKGAAEKRACVDVLFCSPSSNVPQTQLLEEESIFVVCAHIVAGRKRI